MKTKYKIVLIIMAVLAICVLCDYYRSTQVMIQVDSVSPQPAVADSSHPVEVRVSVVRKNGKPVINHNIYALSLGGGSWKSYREKTNNNGQVTFYYYPYTLQSYQSAKDVNIKLRDESNSIFIEIYPETQFAIQLNKQDADAGSEKTNNYFD